MLNSEKKMSTIKFKYDQVVNTATYLAGVEYLVYQTYYTPQGDVCGVDLSQEPDVYDHIHLGDGVEYRITFENTWN